jgi:hypothetical protein
MVKSIQETLEKSSQPTLWASDGSTCSQGSGSGITPLPVQDGETTTGEASGQLVVPARRSQSPAERKLVQRAMQTTLCRMLDELASSYASYAVTNGLPTSGTYSRKCGGSSVTHGPTASLASRLRLRADERGLPLFELRWKFWGMPLGDSIYAVRGSAVSILGSECSSWPTPDATNLCDGVDFPTQLERPQLRRERAKEQGLTGSGRSMTLQMAAQASSLRSWTTPQAHDATARGKGQKPKHGTKHGCADLNADARMTALPWATPSSRDWKDTAGMGKMGTNPDGSTRNRLDQLPRQASLTLLSAWPTARSSDGDKGTRTPEGQVKGARTAPERPRSTDSYNDGVGQADAISKGRPRGDRPQESGVRDAVVGRSSFDIGEPVWIYCIDGKYRAAERFSPESLPFPLDPETARNLGLVLYEGEPVYFPLIESGKTKNKNLRLRGYGDAINAEVATVFIRSVMEILVDGN